MWVKLSCPEEAITGKGSSSHICPSSPPILTTQTFIILIHSQFICLTSASTFSLIHQRPPPLIIQPPFLSFRLQHVCSLRVGCCVNITVADSLSAKVIGSIDRSRVTELGCLAVTCIVVCGYLCHPPPFLKEPTF